MIIGKNYFDIFAEYLFVFFLGGGRASEISHHVFTSEIKEYYFVTSHSRANQHSHKNGKS